MITFGLSEGTADLEGIIALQRLNHARALAPAVQQAHGFVTMEYTVDQLQHMSGPYRHAVARRDGQVVGYALVMLEQARAPFAFLHPMFDAIEAGSLDGRPIRACRWCVMGQVCVAEAARGQGVFDRLYDILRQQLQPHFDLIVTEVSTRNTRSLRAHRRVGFRPIGTTGPPSPEWAIIAWDWRAA